MDATDVLVPAAILTAVVLIIAEILKLNRLIRIIKPLATLLVVAVAAAAFIEGTPEFLYPVLIVTALLLSLVGDIMLMPPDRESRFRTGLIFFLFAHIAYMAAFSGRADWTLTDLATGAVLLLAAAVFYLVIRKNLRKLRIPVIIYMAVICLMVNRAVATGSAIVITGALLFFISDVMLAFSRFRRHWKYERISLAFYYGGQLLLALSISRYS